MLAPFQARAAMAAAESDYRTAASAPDGTPEARARYRAAMEGLIAAYDNMRLVAARN